MPYAQWGYPETHVEAFKKNFPADFIAEGLDQTRGWFYTLMVIGTALFDKAPFKNVVVNGLVLAEDGKQMSKSLRNYPDPMEVLDQARRGRASPVPHRLAGGEGARIALLRKGRHRRRPAHFAQMVEQLLVLRQLRQHR